VVARGWGIPAVVGAADLEVGDGWLRVGDRTLDAGAIITIDGSSGEVFEGAIAGTSEPLPEARTLLAWAQELGIRVPDPNVAARPDMPAAAATTARRVTPDQCLRVVGTKGFALLPGLAEALLSDPDTVRPIVDQLALDGLLATTAGAYRLSEAGTARAAALLDADRAAWGTDAAAEALDAFIPLDHRMKDTVTAWQLRDPEAQVLNDHSDADYDRGVLDRLASLHADASAWLARIETRCARLTDYGARLTRAFEAARAGDQRYVASPRVDSYHGIWFELHEDLIQLAGRTRAEEVDAGRA
jgi:pyruvate,orthophosphate dikinase